VANPGQPTFDQLRIFLAIVETGSFAAAGRKLNRAVSVISYGIGNLEAQLGLTLFDREGTKKPQLTVAGRAVLAEARMVSQGIDGLRAKVKGLLDGLEAEVDLAVDVMLPAERLGRVLRAFAEKFPTVSLRLHVEALGAAFRARWRRASPGSIWSVPDRWRWCRWRRPITRWAAWRRSCPARGATMSRSC
jgi:DNA-binding transcriptional LysR family regulator